LRKKALAGMRQVAAVLISALFLLPVIWAISSSLREPGATPRRLEWLPDPIAWHNYRDVFELIPLFRYALNSLVIAVAGVVITVVSASTAGFAMAQLSQRWRLRLTALSFAVLMVPLTAIWLPRFILFEQAGLIDNRLSLVVPAFMGTSPFYCLLFLWTFLRVPREVYESARLDGASAWRVWAGIALPLARPTVAAVAVLAFVHYWSSYVEPLLYLREPGKRTVTLGLNALYQLDRTNWPLLMAGALTVTLPVVVIFLAAQRAFLQQYRGSGWLGR
jgi:ABC-type glycerol-3-phosphate transport system permease component